jgi:hypothetical protein
MKSDVNAPMMDARAPASSTVVTPGSEWLKARGSRKRPVSVNRLSIERFLHQQTTLRWYEEKSGLLWLVFQREAIRENIQIESSRTNDPVLHLADSNSSLFPGTFSRNSERQPSDDFKSETQTFVIGRAIAQQQDARDYIAPSEFHKGPVSNLQP